MNTAIIFKIKNRHITSDTKSIDLIGDNMDYTAVFDLDEDLTFERIKTARFIKDDVQEERILDDNNSCQIPPELLKKGFISVGVYTDEKSTTPCFLQITRSIRETDYPVKDPEPDVYRQLLDKIEKLKGLREIELRADEKNIQWRYVGEQEWKELISFSDITVSQEEIKQAVKEYLNDNPLEETDPTVPDWAKEPQKPTYTAEEVGALPTSKLPEAIDVALAQAKASGEFNGKDGKDGAPGEKGDPGPKGDPGETTYIENPYNDTQLKNDIGQLRKDLSRLSKDKVENPLTGVVGQILEIETVDESGKPKTYKAVNKPSGGGEVTDEQISNAVDNYMKEHHFTETDPTVPDWAKQSQKPRYTASEVGALPDTTKIPSKTSDLQNDSGFLTEHQDLSDYALKSEVPKSASDVGADAFGTAESKVSEHNVSDTAHNDIRLLIQGLIERLNALADSDDTTLDQMSEVVTYIKSNKSLIDAITTSKINVSDIINNLTTNLSNKVLSASMGVELKKLIDAIKVPVNLSELEGDTTHRTVTDAEKTAWNNKSTFSGNYNDLTNKPSLFSGNYNDLSGKPTLITEERVNELINEEMLKEMLTKVSVADIVDDLTTNVSNKPLSAAQGVALKALIDAITIPDTLPNPNDLTFTGAVTGSYDGSTSLSVNIPSAVTDDHINELINTALNEIGVAEEGVY